MTYNKFKTIMIIFLFVMLTFLAYSLGKTEGSDPEYISTRLEQIENNTIKELTEQNEEYRKQNKELFRITQEYYKQVEKRDEIIKKLFKLHGIET